MGSAYNPSRYDIWLMRKIREDPEYLIRKNRQKRDIQRERRAREKAARTRPITERELGAMRSECMRCVGSIWCNTHAKIGRQIGAYDGRA